MESFIIIIIMIIILIELGALRLQKKMIKKRGSFLERNLSEKNEADQPGFLLSLLFHSPFSSNFYSLYCKIEVEVLDCRRR